MNFNKTIAKTYAYVFSVWGTIMLLLTLYGQYTFIGFRGHSGTSIRESLLLSPLEIAWIVLLLLLRGALTEETTKRHRKRHRRAMIALCVATAPYLIQFLMMFTWRY